MAREASGHANYEVCMLWWPNQLLLVLENERFESGGRSAADPAVGASRVPAVQMLQMTV